MEITGNLRYVAGVTEYVVDGNDGTINVDTSVNSVTIILPNINNSGFANTSKGFIINDISSNASVNNITITANGNSVNSASSVIISNNGGSAKCSIANINEWFIITEPQAGGGTVTNADNGLSLNVNTIELGGTLIQPTTIATDSTNTLNLTDSFGFAFTTRDGAGNWGLATNSINAGSSYVNDYISGGNIYDSSLIIINFGSVKTFTNATDCWTFGDYGTFTNSNQTFSFGRTTTLNEAVSSFTIGDSNTINTSSTIFALGNSNTLNIGNTTSIVGSTNNIENVSSSFVLGNNNLLPIGNSNIAKLYNFGDSLSLTTTAKVSNVLNIGFVNTLNLNAESTGIYLVGDSNNISDFLNNCSVIGSNNTLTGGCSNISLFGNTNTIIGIADTIIIGNNNLNLIVDLLGNIGNTLTMTSKLHITGLLEFTDNADALANSLTAGAFYRTGDIVKVVH